jgi:hypothetical protein
VKGEAEMMMTELLAPKNERKTILLLTILMYIGLC